MLIFFQEHLITFECDISFQWMLCMHCPLRSTTQILHINKWEHFEELVSKVINLYAILHVRWNKIMAYGDAEKKNP